MIIRLKKLCYGVFLIIVSLLATTGCSSVIDDDEGVTERVRVGDHVPQFTASVVDDTGRHSFSTEQLTGETIIVFFNTWCGDCQRELHIALAQALILRIRLIEHLSVDRHAAVTVDIYLITRQTYDALEQHLIMPRHAAKVAAVKILGLY